MNERTVFLTALEKADPAERSAYLDDACAGNLALRERVESLLRSHEREGVFLNVPAIEQLAAPGLSRDRSGDTQEVAASNDDGQSLEFLAPSDRPGSLGRLDHYEIQEVIGRGGMGIVLRAFDEKLHRVVAIKVMAAQLATNATARKRFTREAQAQAAVSHDHVVTIYAVEEASVQPFFVMQYVAGLSLQQRLDRDGPLELPEILRIGMQAASALAAAHAQGLVHRDIKPANILLENGVERVKVTDFGLARARAEASLTQSGVVAGTPQFMSPEQARGDAVDQRTDLFSLGSVLYAMCTGRAPFRASSSLAVLKRVCEETPAPIRDVNPDIPDWLVAIVARLHAKEPAERFQSAAEVAALLSRHLAHVQHPSVAPLPAPIIPGMAGADSARPRIMPRAGRRWVVAAAVVLLLFGGLSLTEAAGVTNLRATVIRIFTPDGTLVVEVDDPGVKVTIEGDGGLVITGAGLEEIRLRPGSYRVQADKDGKRVPLERDLISIAKGGREVVKVKLESPPAQASAKAENGAFVLLAAGEERKFNTLAEAVQGASDGDTIEIRGNGPFVSQPIKINRSLTIRAAAGSRPVIQLSPEATVARADLLETKAPLILEGLDLQAGLDRFDNREGRLSTIIHAWAPLHVANCRLLISQTASATVKSLAQRPRPLGTPVINGGTICELRNCEIIGPFVTAFVSWNTPHLGINFDNCCACLETGINVQTMQPAGVDEPQGSTIRLTRNTFVAPQQFVLVSLYPGKVANSGTEKLPPKALRCETEGNILDTRSAVALFSQTGQILSADALPQVFTWQGTWNLYALGGPFVRVPIFPNDNPAPVNPITSVAEWGKFWGTAEAGSIKGIARYQGGNLLARLESAPEKLTAEDFRLRPDSAGYKAGKDGKDLGADVDLVGPGPAYERWKQTPEYQQWLKDTGQIKSEAPKPEPKAFALMGSKGVAERKFDTLAEAVRGSSDGDTVEIRGNGPFVSQPIKISHSLTIRAAAGSRPVIQLSPEATKARADLLDSEAPLILEGLDLEVVPEVLDIHESRYSSIVIARAPLYVANCRLLLLAKQPRGAPVLTSGPICELRNCEIISPRVYAIGSNYAPRLRVSLDNCCGCLGSGMKVNYFREGGTDYTQESTIRLTRNTFVAQDHSIIFQVYPDKVNLWNKDSPTTPMRCEIEGNILDARLAVALFSQAPPGKILPRGEAEAALPQVFTWHGARNLYAIGGPFLRLMLPNEFAVPVNPIRSVAEWGKYWGAVEAGSIEGRTRYAGGDLLARLASAPEKLTAEDFRLRPDSPGYRAGKDGKDLGADVDLVGPGPAYERWKQTPEYQQWLKDTGQLRAEAPKPEAKAFVLLTVKGIEVRKYDTLAEAVLGASDGDTIEVRGNGPFVSQPITVTRALTIRAGAGCRPVIQLSPKGMGGEQGCLLESKAPLIVEGLDLQTVPEDLDKREGRPLFVARAPLHVANCRLLSRQPVGTPVINYGPNCELRNCQIVGPRVYAIGSYYSPRLRLNLDNCCGCLMTGMKVHYFQHGGVDYTQESTIRLTRNTFVAQEKFVIFQVRSDKVTNLWTKDLLTKPMRCETEGNILDARLAVALFSQTRPGKILPPAEAEASLPQVFTWHGARNLYAVGGPFLTHHINPNESPAPVSPIRSIEEWGKYWGTGEAGSIEGRVRYQGGDLLARLAVAPEKLTAEDFRLRPDSAGYRAGKDGKDLGADVDLVGPGPAYERWQKTPEYQQWLKDTGQSIRGQQ